MARDFYIEERPHSFCGIYLKWRNNMGGYSYFLFEKFREETLSVSGELDLMPDDENDRNVAFIEQEPSVSRTLDIRGISKDAGTTALFKSLVTSGEVYLFYGERYRISDLDKFMRVRVEKRSYRFSNKTEGTVFTLTILLP